MKPKLWMCYSLLGVADCDGWLASGYTGDGVCSIACRLRVWMPLAATSAIKLSRLLISLPCSNAFNNKLGSIMLAKRSRSRCSNSAALSESFNCDSGWSSSRCECGLSTPNKLYGNDAGLPLLLELCRGARFIGRVPPMPSFFTLSYSVRDGTL